MTDSSDAFNLRQLEDTLAELPGIQEDGIMACNHACRIVYLNDVVLEQFGYTRDELIGESVGKLLPAPLGAMFERAMTTFVSSGFSKIAGTPRNLAGTRKDGTSLLCETTINDVVINGLRFFWARFRNIAKEADTAKTKLPRIIRLAPEGCKTLRVFGVNTTCESISVNMEHLSVYDDQAFEMVTAGQLPPHVPGPDCEEPGGKTEHPPLKLSDVCDQIISTLLNFDVKPVLFVKLAWNSIGDAGVPTILQKLKPLPSLKQLDMVYNKLSSDGIIALITGLLELLRDEFFAALDLRGNPGATKETVNKALSSEPPGFKRAQLMQKIKY